jgi:putative heme-binding domain-containing protein
LRNEALRSLRGCAPDEHERATLARIDCSDEATAQLLARVLQTNSAAGPSPPLDTDAWLQALRGSAGRIEGDPHAGARIFFHQKAAGCARCHQIAGRGARIGPELTATTAALAEERLVASIVRPGQEIAPQFVSWLVETTDGKSFVGMLVHQEATGEQTYADPQGKLIELGPGEVERRQPQSTSIMPDNLTQQLTVQEFRDLVAFLRSQ